MGNSVLTPEFGEYLHPTLIGRLRGFGTYYLEILLRKGLRRMKLRKDRIKQVGLLKDGVSDSLDRLTNAFIGYAAAL